MKKSEKQTIIYLILPILSIFISYILLNLLLDISERFVSMTPLTTVGKYIIYTIVGGCMYYSTTLKIPKKISVLINVVYGILLLFFLFHTIGLIPLPSVIDSFLSMNGSQLSIWCGLYVLQLLF